MSGKAIRESLGFLAVVASMVFVGLEIQQNTKAVRAATFQALSDAASTGALQAATDDHLPALMALIRDEDPSFAELTPEDRERIRFMYLHTVRRVENIFVQVSEAVVDEDAYMRFQPTAGYIGSGAFRGFWLETRPGLAPDFVAFFEERYPGLVTP